MFCKCIVVGTGHGERHSHDNESQCEGGGLKETFLFCLRTVYEYRQEVGRRKVSESRYNCESCPSLEKAVVSLHDEYYKLPESNRSKILFVVCRLENAYTLFDYVRIIWESDEYRREFATFLRWL